MELNTAIINHSIVNLNNTRSAEYEWLANCGVYTEHEEDALALATILGSNGKKEISRRLDYAYYHFHDKMRYIHIWFGEPG